MKSPNNCSCRARCPHHCPRGGRCPHHGPRGGRCPHHGPRGDGRPRPSRRAQLGQSALSQKRNHLGVGLVARKPALPPPTWVPDVLTTAHVGTDVLTTAHVGTAGPRPSGRAQLGQSALSKTRKHLGCRSLSRKKTSPTTAHVGADVLTTAHVGTAALGRPAERSSASQLCPRRE